MAKISDYACLKFLHQKRLRVATFTFFVLFSLVAMSILTSSQTIMRYRIFKRRKISPVLNQIWMSREESSSLLRYTKGMRTYLEWGSGGSTLNIAPLASERAVSIEHNVEWCKKMNIALEKRNLSNVEFVCVPQRRSTGTDGTYQEFRSYIDKINSLNQETWDFILIDGRARVVAAIKALSYLSPTSIVALHDFCRISYHIVGPNNYSPVLYFYDIVHYIPTGQGIAFLKRKYIYDWMQGKLDATQNLLDSGNNLFKLTSNSSRLNNVNVSKSCSF